MAITATLSPCSSTLALKPTKLLYHPSKLSIPHQFFHFHSHTPSHRNPTSIICHSKLDHNSAGQHSDEIGEAFFEDNDMVEDESDDEDDEAESSVDLFVRFLHSMFRKLSKRAKKAARSILPAVISPQLVSFGVDGVLLLVGLSIGKALLEVVCTLGSAVFTAILLIRVIWAAISYFQSGGNTFNQGGGSFGTNTMQPVL
uniref:Protein SHORT HYPOCOTYL IN WHITE LIGHT 1 n=2 Tax=Rhizophora mucronata TaxID=61149 RepID=A0A2P2J7F4_RHIMU